MTKFKANRKFPNPITVTDDPRSHTLALQQVIEALNIGQRRTKEINSSYVRLGELVDVGLIEIVNGQLKLTNLGRAVAAGASALSDLTDVDVTGLANGDTLIWNSGTSKWEPGSTVLSITGADMYDVALNDLIDVAFSAPADGDVLTYDTATGKWVSSAPTGGSSGITPDTRPTTPNVMDDEFDGTAFDTAKWTFVGGTSSTGVVVADSLVYAPNSFVCQQAISGNFKVRAKIIGSPFTANGQQFTLQTMRTASGNGHAFGLYRTGSGTYIYGVINYTGTYTGYSGIASQETMAAPVLEVALPIYLEIEYAGTTLYFRRSRSGWNNTFSLFYSVSAASYLGGAPDRVGFFNTGGYSIDWFRRVS